MTVSRANCKIIEIDQKNRITRALTSRNDAGLSSFLLCSKKAPRLPAPSASKRKRSIFREREICLGGASSGSAVPAQVSAPAKERDGQGVLITKSIEFRFILIKRCR